MISLLTISCLVSSTFRGQQAVAMCCVPVVQWIVWRGLSCQVKDQDSGLPRAAAVAPLWADWRCVWSLRLEHCATELKRGVVSLSMCSCEGHVGAGGDNGGRVWCCCCSSSYITTSCCSSSRDFISATWSLLPALFTCLALLLSPLKVLPQLERFERIYLWMGTDAQSRQSVAKFAKKLDETRCYIIGYEMIISTLHCFHLRSILYVLCLCVHCRPTDERDQFTSALDALNEVKQVHCTTDSYTHSLTLTHTQDLNIKDIVARAKPVCHKQIITFKQVHCNSELLLSFLFLCSFEKRCTLSLVMQWEWQESRCVDTHTSLFSCSVFMITCSVAQVSLPHTTSERS